MDNKKAILVFQTDFTYLEGAVAAMYGVVKSVDTQLEIIDATHQIPRYDVYSASYRLYQYYRFWPTGTVFVSVVDPGVGTTRKAAVAETIDGNYIVTPDNGTLTHLHHSGQIREIREIDESINRLKGYGTENTSVFHGRDFFAYCAARLAAGIISYEEVGKAYPLSEIICFPLPQAAVNDDKVSGHLEIGDPNFGNLWTNIPLELFLQAGYNFGESINVTVTYQDREVFRQSISFEKTFGMVNKGDMVVYVNELSKIAIALNQDSLMEKYRLGYGTDWEVTFDHE